MKYKAHSVSTDIYVSSNCDWYIEFIVEVTDSNRDKERYKKGYYWLGIFEIEGISRPPNYLMRALELAIVKALRGDVKFHECDQYGNKRYEPQNHRYVDWHTLATIDNTFSSTLVQRFQHLYPRTTE